MARARGTAWAKAKALEMDQAPVLGTALETVQVQAQALATVQVSALATAQAPTALAALAALH